MGSSKDVAPVEHSNVPPVPGRLNLGEIPSLAKLLKDVFFASCEIEQPLEEQNRDSSCAKRQRMAISDEIFGIPIKDFKNDPCFLLAIQRLLDVLKKLVTAERECKLYDMKGAMGEDAMMKICKALVELKQLESYTWEQLNIGHWKSVSILWRKVFTCLVILKVAFMILKTSPILTIIRECDMGLLMGAPIYGNVLMQIAEEISAIIISGNYEETTTVQKKLTDGHGKDNLRTSMDLLSMDIPLRNKSNHDKKIFTFEQPSMLEFLNLIKSSTPAHLSGICDSWPAMKKWSVEYIQKVAGFRSAPVEIGQRYTSEDWTQKIMTINDFVEKYMNRIASDSDFQPQEIGYIAQHNLFDQLPILLQDIRIPDYCVVKETCSSPEDVRINAWFGPANTISPCHYDEKDNILVQVFGSKVIRLFPPAESELLQPHPPSSLLFNTSQLDVEQIDLFEKYPEMENVIHYDVILKAGQALFIPSKWWHYVKSLSPSFSVSFWF